MTTNLAAAGARGGSITIVGQIVSQLIGIVGLIVLARLIAPEVFGLIAVISTINAFATAIIFLGTGMASAQAVVLSNRAKSSLFYLNSATGLLMAGALYALANPIATLYGQPNLVVIVQWLSLIPLLSGIQAQFRINLVRNLRFSLVSVSAVISQVVAIAISITLAMLGFTYEAIIAQVLSQIVLQLVLLVGFAGWLPGVPGNWRSEVRGILAIGVRIFGINVLKDLSRSVVIPVIGLVAPASVVGNFDRAQQLAVMPINLTVDRLQEVAIPILSRLREQPDRMLAFMLRAQLLGTYGTATGFLIIAALSQPLIHVVLGPDWSLTGDLLQIFAIGAVFRLLGQSMHWIFISTGKSTAGLKFSAWSQPTIVALTLAGLPWGVTGAAIANSIAWALYWPLATFAASKAANLRTRTLFAQPLRIIFSFGVPVGLCALAGRLLPLGEVSMLLAGMVLALAGAATLVGLVPRIRTDTKLLVSTLRLALIRQPLERD